MERKTRSGICGALIKFLNGVAQLSLGKWQSKGGGDGDWRPFEENQSRSLLYLGLFSLRDSSSDDTEYH